MNFKQFVTWCMAHSPQPDLDISRREKNTKEVYSAEADAAEHAGIEWKPPVAVMPAPKNETKLPQSGGDAKPAAKKAAPKKGKKATVKDGDPDTVDAPTGEGEDKPAPKKKAAAKKSAKKDNAKDEEGDNADEAGEKAEGGEKK